MLAAPRLRLLGVFFLLGVRAWSGQEVELWQSADNGARLARLPGASFAPGEAAGLPAFRIDPAVRHQAMIGFGASFQEAGMICLNSLDAEARDRVLQALFDPVQGAGFTAMKTVLGATDFMSAGPFFSYDDTPGDREMKFFSIGRDLAANGLVPYIKHAQRYGNFILQATMDYPPDWMLVDVKTNQDIDPQYYDALALYYLRYVQAYKKEGITIDYLSLFNEPTGYTQIPYARIGELLKKHVGPLFHRSEVATRLILGEHWDRSGAARNYPVVLDDPEASRYLSAIAYHGYDWRAQAVAPIPKNGYANDEFARIAALHKKYRLLPLWMTEVCYWNGGTPWAKPLPRYEFADGDFWGNQILNDLEAGAAGWTYWNMILDQNGGPWLVSEVHHDGEQNQQHPVVIIDRETHTVSYTGLYYYLAHFSKFIRPGFVRVDTAGAMPGVRCATFSGPHGLLVAEILNSNATETEVRLVAGGQTLLLRVPGVSITTCQWTHRE
ncbi:MAG TPA: hypothetical protein VHD61_03020 [Lacunisphaera sp.]|nr:hypothetical protein [Lacunisphaera sp.]